MLVYKLYKDQVQRAFQIWLLSGDRFGTRHSSLARMKPPIGNFTMMEGSSAKKFFGESGKANSSNNSVMNNSRNLRYSNLGNNDDEILDEYYSSKDDLTRAND
mmetsp:Transcript_14855/g.14430  ORF Transcript_14855/g.14430 Transcript_14855/m.14430 type:complete len:103 (+) Transcript_14855:1666-1974(+)